MPSLAELKASSPDYAGLSDEEFANRVYERHYADKMDRAEFDVRTGTGKRRPGSTLLGSERFARLTDQIMDPIGVIDEAQGAGAFASELIKTGSLEKAGKAYSDVGARIRAERKVAREENSILPDIIGGFATMGPAGVAEAVASGIQAARAAGGTLPARATAFGDTVGTAIQARNAATPLGRRIATGAGEGAAYGGVAGFAQGEGDVLNRGIGAAEGGAAGAVLGPLVSEVAVPAAIRTGVGVRQAVRYGNQAVRNARNPEQAAVDLVADRIVGAGIDPAALRATVSPATSANLQRRGFTEEQIADIVSRGLRGEPAAQIGQDHGISAGTVNRYVNAYRDANPTPMNLMDIAKEVAGEGGSAPVTRLGRAAYSLAGDESGEAAQRLMGRQDTQAGRVSNIVQRSVAGGDFEATRAAGLQNLRDEADTAYRQFYAEPDLGIDQLDDLMADPLFRRANVQAQRQARVEAIRRNQEARRSGQPLEPVPEVDPNNQVFSPEMLDLIQRQLRIASEGAVSNPNNARHARNLREVFLDRIEDHYPTFRGIRRDYATAMGEFGEEGALEAGAALTTKLGAPTREALRGFDDMTVAQQELFRLGFARKLMDMAANPQIGGAVANQFNTNAVREIVERLYPRSNAAAYRQGQQLLRDLRREAITTRTKNDVTQGARTAELGSDMGRMMEGAQAAADVATGRWTRLLENLSTRLSTQIGRRGAREVLDLLTQTDPARLLPLLNRLARSATTIQQRQAYVAALREIRSIGTRRLSGIVGQKLGQATAIEEMPQLPSP